MPTKTQQVISNFSGGIVSALLADRVDIETWQNSLRESLNWLIGSVGNGLMRPGCEYVAQAKATTPEDNKRLVPFGWEDRDFLLEIGHEYLRIYDDGKFRKEFATPWVSDQVMVLQYAQKRTGMTFVHGAVRPQELKYDPTTNNWTLEQIDFASVPQVDFDDDQSPDPTDSVWDVTFETPAQGQQYILRYNGASTNLLSYSTTPVTNETRIEAALAALATVSSDSTVTAADQGGNVYRVTISGPSAGGTLVAIGVDLDVTVAVVTPGGSRAEDAWSDLRGWPCSVTFFEQRLMMGGTELLPEYVWGSKTAEPRVFYEASQPLDTSPIERVIDSTIQVLVRWLYGAGDNILIGTSVGHYTLSGDGGPLTPFSFQFRKTTSDRSDRIMPVAVNSEIAYVKEGRESIESLIYYERRGTQVSANLLIAAQQLAQSTLGQPFRSTRPETFIVTTNEGGELLICAYNSERGMTAWTRHTHAQGTIRHACVVREGKTDSIYVAVEWDGLLHIERIRPNIYDVDKPETYGWRDLPYMDSCKQQITTELTNEITGLGHLNGKLCSVIVDQATHPDVVVSGGRVVTDFAGYNIVVGIKYPNELRTQQLGSGGQRGFALGQKRRWVRPFLQLVESVRPTVNGVKVDDRTPSTPMGEAEPHVTEAVEYRIDGWNDGVLSIVNPHAGACCVASIHGEVSTGSDG